MKRHKRRKKRDRRQKKGKPIIGITCEVVKLKPYFAEFELSCDYRYVRAVIRAGGIPMLLPINPFSRDAAKVLEHIDGLVIIGGADIHPSFYGEKSKQKIQPIYRGRTYFEMHLYKAAQKKKIPVLAICHGMQLLNVIYGGTLHQDIQSEVKGAKDHCSKRQPLHRVEIQPGSLCHKIFRKRSVVVHSHHHQAVKVPGHSIRITAVAEDGIPEAIEGPPRTIAVQWHPERTPKDSSQAKLFRYFIRLTRENPDPSF
ncbi:MAG: gamma-glutamyl-gamma-aminobutyrate hydrolase family protein [Candidatus Omnitrophica bacterium]|nr:gamma-glutamyl-gamma-aminobutyrate hydrolase family protein [Candidatus Omnitrophota bacterium]